MTDPTPASTAEPQHDAAAPASGGPASEATPMAAPAARLGALTLSMFLLSFGLVLFELLLTRLFGVVLFAQFAHLALALALLGISVGAIAQHLRPSLLPAEGLERRLAWVALLQGAATLIAVLCTLYFPVTVQFDEPPSTYQERSTIKDDLLDPVWFAALLPVLAAPFALAGLGFAGVFQRCKQHIGRLYGADLLGGAAGAVLFLPVLAVWSAPDAVFVVTLGASIAAGALAGPGRLRGGAALMGLGSLLGLSVGLVEPGGRSEALKVRYAAGYDERNITYTEWTPLTRVSVHEGARGVHMLLDNTSASQVFRTERERDQLRKHANRSLVYRLHEGQEGCRAAILAASAGPEVSIAQAYGWSQIDAIDIAGGVMQTVAERFAELPINPYTKPGVRLIESDGRAAILHAHEPYCIIQMVHANLWSSAGLVSNAWSPSLLETQEAWETYLARLSPDGTVSFGRGSETPAIARAAAAALRTRGVTEPWRHMAYLTGDNTVLLVKARPWTDEEVGRLRSLMGSYNQAELRLDPTVAPSAAVRAQLIDGAVMTDDRPYLDDPSLVIDELRSAISTAGDEARPLAAVYKSIVIQVIFALGAGLAFIGLPLLRRSETSGLERAGLGVLYVAGLGYGYLAVETVLIHALVLFVGHPTYAVTIVILAMLLMSGIGSEWAGRLADRSPERLLGRLRVVLAGIIVLGLIQAFVLPPLLYANAQGAPVPVRLLLTFVALAPLGLLMGMPFPMALRLLRPEAAALVPWAWAINGWMSVMASLLTVTLSRMYGYKASFGLALAAYLVALLVAGSLPKIRRSSP